MNILATIKKWWGKRSYTEIGKLTGQSANAVRCMGKRNGLPTLNEGKKNTQHKIVLSPGAEVERDSKIKTLDKLLNVTGGKARILAEQNEVLKQKVAIYESRDGIDHYKLPPYKMGRGGGATAVAIFSDFHYGEVITKVATMGRNEYDCAIAKQRADNFFVNVVRLLHNFKLHSSIETLVLALLGDLITGEIHEALAETNEAMAMEATLGVTRILKSGIRHILDNTDVRLEIPCVVGNHSRNTKKIHHKNGAQHSYEWVIYNLLMDEFRNEKRIRFYIPLGEFVVLGLNDDKFKIRFSHGFQIRYVGGVGGVQAPASRVINGWQSYDVVNLDCFGHHHSFFATSQFVCNGSVCGTGEYAASNGFRFEPAQQAFFLIDHKLDRRTTTCPVFVE